MSVCGSYQTLSRQKFPLRLRCGSYLRILQNAKVRLCNKFSIVFRTDICYNVGVMRCKIVTRGKPFQSKLAPYEAEIQELVAGDTGPCRRSKRRWSSGVRME